MDRWVVLPFLATEPVDFFDKHPFVACDVRRGRKPGEFDSSSNSSSRTLKENVSGPSSEATQNIFPATEKHRSWPHLTSSVTAGSARQKSRNVSIFISLKRRWAVVEGIIP